MKSIILIAVLCTIAVSALTCSQTSCSAIGGSCSSECGDCQVTFATCASADPSNATAVCACYTNVVNCLAATKNPSCGSQDQYANCVSAFTGVYNCSCGSPYTSNTVYECSSGYCSNTSTCMAYKSVGQACSSDDECGSDSSIFGTQYSCESGKCAKLTQLFPGDSCSANSDCVLYGPYNLGCTNGICASQKVGSECPGDFCGSGLYCDDDDTCQTEIPIGGKCSMNATSSGCASNGVCDNSVCVAPQSKSIGDACEDSLECQWPAYCSKKSGKCAAALPQPSCTNNTYCTDLNSDYVACVCMGSSSTCQADYNAAQLKQYWGCSGPIENLGSCASKNGCSEYAVAGGCLETHCSNEYACYFNCMIAADDSLCTDLKATCSTTGAGEKNVVAFAMIALALFAYFL